MQDETWRDGGKEEIWRHGGVGGWPDLEDDNARRGGWGRS